MPKISVIMPSLNVANYIEQCMESVINQTLRDIEIIAVDAGSTDGTLEILEKYESTDNRVRVIHSSKRSYGYQLNLGISIAHGNFIGVVETDDYIESNMYESLYKQALKSKADYVKGGALKFFEKSEGETYSRKIEVFTEKEFAHDQGRISVNPSVTPELILKDYYLWTGIYEKNFIKSIKLNETSGPLIKISVFFFKHFVKQKKQFI